MKDGTRRSITITQDIYEEIERLKQADYYNKPYSELYRDLIRGGIKMYHKNRRK